jgi:poly(beta-D-mannuronate) lyase
MDIARRGVLIGTGASALANPYDAAGLRVRKGRPAQASATCQAAPAPARDLIVPQFYTDPPVFSRVDPERLAARDAAVAPVQALLRTVTENADRWASSAPVQGRFAACAARALEDAARARSFLGLTDSQGAYERKWAWCGLALAHLKLVQAPEYDGQAQASVREWLARGFDAMRGPYDRPPSGTPSIQMNNHMTWAGLTAMAIGLAADDRRAWDWGLARMTRTLAQVDADGFLPQEVLRASKAQHYHIFIMGPIALGAVLARANAIDLAGAPDGPFHRLARRTLAAYADPSAFVRRTGVAQDAWAARPDVGWLELYAGEFGAAEALEPLRGRRPQRQVWLGGDLTLWHARDV